MSGRARTRARGRAHGWAPSQPAPPGAAAPPPPVSSVLFSLLYAGCFVFLYCLPLRCFHICKWTSFQPEWMQMFLNILALASDSSLGVTSKQAADAPQISPSQTCPTHFIGRSPILPVAGAKSLDPSWTPLKPFT